MQNIFRTQMNKKTLQDMYLSSMFQELPINGANKMQTTFYLVLLFFSVLQNQSIPLMLQQERTPVLGGKLKNLCRHKDLTSSLHTQNPTCSMSQSSPLLLPCLTLYSCLYPSLHAIETIPKWTVQTSLVNPFCLPVGLA